MIQLTEEQAIEIANSKIYKNWSSDEVVKFQLFQEKLCMDFSHFHKCVEEILGRSVFTHEFAYPDLLRKEYLGDKEPPSFSEIINLIPKEKLVILT